MKKTLLLTVLFAFILSFGVLAAFPAHAAGSCCDKDKAAACDKDKACDKAAACEKCPCKNGEKCTCDKDCKCGCCKDGKCTKDKGKCPSTCPKSGK